MNKRRYSNQYVLEYVSHSFRGHNEWSHSFIRFKWKAIPILIDTKRFPPKEITKKHWWVNHVNSFQVCWLEWLKWRSKGDSLKSVKITQHMRHSGRRNAWTGPFFIEHEEPQMTLFTMAVHFVGMQSIKLSSDLAFVSNETEEKKNRLADPWENAHTYTHFKELKYFDRNRHRNGQ